MYIGDFEEAEEIFLRVLPYFKTFKNSENLSIIYSNLGIISSKLARAKDGIVYFNLALKNTENQKWQAGITHELGLTYEANCNYKEAIEQYENSLRIRENQNFSYPNYSPLFYSLTTSDESSIYYRLAACQGEIGLYQKAEKSFKRGLALYDGVDSIQNKIFDFEKLKDIAVKTEDFKKAYKLLAESLGLSHSVELKQNTRFSDSIKIVNETKIKERELFSLSQKNDDNLEKITSQRNYLLIGSLTAGLFALLGVRIWYQRNKFKKLNRIIKLSFSIRN
jgi:tetratricopeptide (TPR) repeat protein